MQLRPGFGPIALALGIAAAPALLSGVIHPWLYTVALATPPTFDLPGETSLRELARVESLHIYAGTLQTLLTPRSEWPAGTPRDAVLIQTTDKEANAPPGSSTWTDRTIRRMFLDRIGPSEARRVYYESEGLKTAPPLEGEMATAVRFLHAIEPYGDGVPFGQVRHFSVPIEYTQRTGIRHILSVAVEPPNRPPPGENAMPSKTVAAPLAAVIESAKEHGVRFLAIPFIGAHAGEGFDADVYDMLLAAAIDTASDPGSLDALYIGAYADAPERRRELLTAYNMAWQRARVKLQPREKQLVDIGWRLTSLMSVIALMAMWQKSGVRTSSATLSARLAVAVVLIAKGLAETIVPLLDTSVARGLAVIPMLALLAFVAAFTGWFLPLTALFDPRKLMEDEVKRA